MTAALLVLNAGSSNLKWGVFTAEPEPLLLARGQLDTLGTERFLTARNADGTLLEQHPLHADDTADAPLRALLTWLALQEWQVQAIAHRIVHGGKRFDRSVKLSPEVLSELEGFSPLAPLHQPVSLAAVKLLARLLPNLPQYGAFDTAFHHGHKLTERAFALPRHWLEEGVERYGFHGLSYASIQRRLPGLLGEEAHGRIVLAHLGNGSSLCALKDGKSVASSMGFTALDGLMMGTRSGRLDAGVLLYFLQEKGYAVEDIERLLYKESGLKGFSGISHDVRVLEQSGKPEAKEALALYASMAAKEIGGMLMVLGGIDALVFTGGIGEHSAGMRERICAYLDWLGVRVEGAANKRHFTRISTADSSIPVLVMQADEEGEIARQCAALAFGG